MTTPRNAKGTTPAVDTMPSEEQILRELKQREKRKQYMSSDKAKANRQIYMKKKYEQTKSDRAAIASLKESDPGKYAELEARAKAAVAAEAAKKTS